MSSELFCDWCHKGLPCARHDPPRTALGHMEEAGTLLTLADAHLSTGRLHACGVTTQLATAHMALAELLIKGE